MRKSCNWCKEEKSVKDFYSKKDGYIYSYCKKCSNEKSKLWHKNNPEKHRKSSSRWNKNNKTKRNEIQKISNKKCRDRYKKEVMDYYGDSKCQCCGEDNMYFLSIDHINGDGKKHREEIGVNGSQLYWWLRKNNYPEGFRVLCFNCNQGRQFTKDKICPHKL